MCDDRDSGKLWQCNADQMVLYIINGLALDTEVWTPRLDLDQQTALNMCIAKGVAGLPDWLRRKGGPQKKDKCEVPSLFPLVKSKCWADGGRWGQEVQ